MTGLVLCFAVLAVMIGGALFLLEAGIRAGDRPGDATVTGRVGEVAQPDGRWPVVHVTVRNPSASPVLVGLSARSGRMRAWIGAGGTSVPFRTARRRFRPDGYTVVGVVGAGGVGQWQVPPPTGARRCRLVAVIGQAEGRLRVIRMPVGPLPAVGRARQLPGVDVARLGPVPRPADARQAEGRQGRP